MDYLAGQYTPETRSRIDVSLFVLKTEQRAVTPLLFIHGSPLHIDRNWELIFPECPDARREASKAAPAMGIMIHCPRGAVRFHAQDAESLPLAREAAYVHVSSRRRARAPGDLSPRRSPLFWRADDPGSIGRSRATANQIHAGSSAGAASTNAHTPG